MPTPVSHTLALRRIAQGKAPRECFDPGKMVDLEAGLRTVGLVIQPISVRSIPGPSATN